MRAIRKACIYVDWHNVEANLNDVTKRPRYLQNIILRIQDEVARALKQFDSTVRYRTTLRLYYGWHSHYQPTSTRLAFETLFLSESFARTIGVAAFVSEIKFGNELACDSLRNPLFSTVRPQGQKMVDTAIVFDLLYMLKVGAADVGIIMSDDDDYVPASCIHG